MLEQLLSQIQQAKKDHIKLFLCGVEHKRLHTFVSLGQIVSTLMPDIILFEGYTPECTYKQGIALGSFQKELKDIHSQKRKLRDQPCLADVAPQIDPYTILVKGVDSSPSRHTFLERKYNLNTQRVLKIFQTLYTRTDELIYLTPKKLSVPAYKRMELLSNRLYDEQRGYYTGDINVVGGCYNSLSIILDAFQDLHVFFADVLSQFTQLRHDFHGYDTERDTDIFSNLRREYDGHRTLLLCIGGHHIEDSPLLRLLEEHTIPYFKFITYQQPLC